MSLEELWENTEYEVADTDDLEEVVMKKAMIEELHRALDELEEIGQVIAMSQMGVNKRKRKLFMKLKTKLKDLE